MMGGVGRVHSAEKEVGDEIKDGQEIATSRNSGASTGPHVHLELAKAKSLSGVFNKANKMDAQSVGDLQSYINSDESESGDQAKGGGEVTISIQGSGSIEDVLKRWKENIDKQSKEIEKMMREVREIVERRKKEIEKNQKMKKIKSNVNLNRLLCGVSVLIILSCKSNSSKNTLDSDLTQSKVTTTLKAEIEDFDSFMYKFERDSSFQLSRVDFPLAGFNSELHLSNPDENVKQLEGEPVNVYWQKATWIVQTPLNNSTGEFKQDRKKTDSLVVDVIYIPDSDFKIKRTFKRIEGKWYLVYYSE